MRQLLYMYVLCDVTGTETEGVTGLFCSYLADLAERTGTVTAVACMFHNASHPTGTFHEIEEIEAAAAQGVSLWGQVSPAPLNMEFTLESPYVFEGLLTWQQHAMPWVSERTRYCAQLADTQWRESVKAELQERQNGLTDQLSDLNWGNMTLVRGGPGDSAMEGRTVAELAAMMTPEGEDEVGGGKHPLDFMLDYSLAHELSVCMYVCLCTGPFEDHP